MEWYAWNQERYLIACTVSVIGDRWSLLILRDCVLGIRTFEDFQRRLGLSRPMLVDRLRKLVDEKVMKKMGYQDSATRYQYRLTAKGMDLHPILMAIVHSKDIYMAGRAGRPRLHRHVKCGHLFGPVMACFERNAALFAKGRLVRGWYWGLANPLRLTSSPDHQRTRSL